MTYAIQHNMYITVTSHGHHAVSTARKLDCLFIGFFGLIAKKTEKVPHFWSVVRRIRRSPLNSPHQRNAEGVSILRRHRGEFSHPSYHTGPKHIAHEDVVPWWRYQMETFSCPRWIPRTEASDAELWCFLWSTPWINGWVNNGEAGDLRRHRAHYDVIVMWMGW